MFWIIVDARGILIHLGKAFFGDFEILNNYGYGTSWETNVLESCGPWINDGTFWKSISWNPPQHAESHP